MKNVTLFDDYNDSLLLVYKICSPICVFLNLLAVYLIIFKSSNEMKTYRWHLLNYQVWTSVIDIFLNFFFQPVVFLPLMVLTGHGFLITNLGISTFTCCCIFANILYGLSVSIMELFLYRHQCIVSRKLTKFYFYILLQFFVIGFILNVFLILSYTDSSQWSEMLKKWNPMAMELLKVPNLFYTPYSTFTRILDFIAFIVAIFLMLLVWGLAYHIFYVLRKDSKHLSANTRKMQRKFLIALILQVTVPFIFLVIPAVFTFYRILDGRLGLQMFNNVASVMMSSYGIFTTLFLIYFNDPYRKFLLKKLKMTALPISSTTQITKIS